MSAARAALRTLRPHQWAKNLLVLVPLVASHRVLDTALLATALAAFVAFSLVASSAYALNDILDLAADRAHPRKRFRPLAAGALSVGAGIALSAAALACGAIIAARLPVGFQVALVAYYLLTVAYSLALRNLLLLDVIALAALYILRIIAGGMAVGVALSSWLLAFALFLFTSLALVKRYAELHALGAEGIPQAPGRGYRATDAPVVMALGTASAALSTLVLAFYATGETVRILYTRPEVLWLLVPVLLYWLGRVWVLAARGEMHEDPVLFALRDPTSYFTAAAGAAVAWLAT